MSTNQLIGFSLIMSGLSLVMTIGLAGLGLVGAGFMYMTLPD